MSKTNGFIEKLPDWGRVLAQKYFTKTVSQFILHGAVRDHVHYDDNGTAKFYRLPDFLETVLFAGRDFVMRYDRSKGLTFADNETARDFRNYLQATDTVTGSAHTIKLSRDTTTVLLLIERYIHLRLSEGKSIAVVLDYAETIAPQSDGNYQSDADRSTLVTLQRWANDPDFLAADVTVVLICENLSSLSAAIVRSPFTQPIEISLPNEEERLSYINAKATDAEYKKAFDVPKKTLAKLTSGLSRVHIMQIINEALRQEGALGFAGLMQRKKEIIEAECYGLLEFYEPKYTLNMVAGHDEAKKELRSAAKMLKLGRLDVLPMGYLICGPVGTGKTFLATCFTGEIGVPCVKILNIRSQWQGVTEANMQKLLGIFKAMGPMGVIIDEADAFLGDRDASGDSGTSSRIFSQIASFMSNTDYRGRILWFLLTCRPDLLPVDIKRQGRAEEHLALFHPETKADRQKLFEVFVKKNHVETTVKSIEPIYKGVGQPKLSGADMEAVIIRGKKNSAVRGHNTVTEKDIWDAFEQFVPPVYAEEVEYQTLVAVFECTNRKMIPKEFRNVPRDQLARRLAELKRYIT